MILLLKERVELVKNFLRIDRTARIVRRVDDDRLRLRCDGLFDLGHDRKESIRICIDDDRDSFDIGNIVQILKEERGKKQYLVARLDDGTKDVVHTGGRTAGHADRIDPDRYTALGRELICNRLSCLRVTGIGHIAMHAGNVGIGELDQSILYFLWRLEVWIADGKVEYLIFAVDLLESCAFIKHLADQGTAGKLCFYLFRNHLVHFLFLCALHGFAIWDYSIIRNAWDIIC